MAESSDDRDSSIYATRGYYALGSFRVYPTWLGSDSEWQTFQTDFRTYAPTQSPDGFWGAAAFVDPITRGFEKVYAVGVEGAKGLFLGTGEAF